MKKVSVSYGIGYGTHETVLEFDDDATDEEIEDDVRDYVMERVSYGYEVEPS